MNFTVPPPVACTTFPSVPDGSSGGNLTLLSDDWISSDTVLLNVGANRGSSGVDAPRLLSTLNAKRAYPFRSVFKADKIVSKKRADIHGYQDLRFDSLLLIAVAMTWAMGWRKGVPKNPLE